MIHPRELNTVDLMNLRAVTVTRHPEVARRFADSAGRIWDIVPGFGEPWVRVYAGYDLGRRTQPYIAGPGVAGLPRRALLPEARARRLG
jgi:hypothetical protein